MNYFNIQVIAIATLYAVERKGKICKRNSLF